MVDYLESPCGFHLMLCPVVISVESHATLTPIAQTKCATFCSFNVMNAKISIMEHAQMYARMLIACLWQNSRCSCRILRSHPSLYITSWCTFFRKLPTNCVDRSLSQSGKVLAGKQGCDPPLKKHLNHGVIISIAEPRIFLKLMILQAPALQQSWTESAKKIPNKR